MTSKPFSTCSHFRHTEVSRPPEYARTTFSLAWPLFAFIVVSMFNLLFVSRAVAACAAGVAFDSPPLRPVACMPDACAVMVSCGGCGASPPFARKQKSTRRCRVLQGPYDGMLQGSYLVWTARNTRVHRSVLRRSWRRKENCCAVANMSVTPFRRIAVRAYMVLRFIALKRESNFNEYSETMQGEI